VSRQVSLDEKAIHQATAFLADDPDGLRAVLAAIDALTSDPHPEGAFPFGATGLHRLRVGRYRVLYTVTEDLIAVGHIARTAAKA
jgi:mRNA interferase RelE/StbE